MAVVLTEKASTASTGSPSGWASPSAPSAAAWPGLGSRQCWLGPPSPAPSSQRNGHTRRSGSLAGWPHWSPYWSSRSLGRNDQRNQAGIRLDRHPRARPGS